MTDSGLKYGWQRKLPRWVRDRMDVEIPGWRDMMESEAMVVGIMWIGASASAYLAGYTNSSHLGRTEDE